VELRDLAANSATHEQPKALTPPAAEQDHTCRRAGASQPADHERGQAKSWPVAQGKQAAFGLSTLQQLLLAVARPTGAKQGRPAARWRTQPVGRRAHNRVSVMFRMGSDFKFGF